MEIYRLHPILVHAPIVLPLVAIITFILALTGKQTVRMTLWLLGFGILGAWAAVLSGDWAEEHAEHVWGVPESLLEAHETYGYVAAVTLTVGFVLLLLWRRFAHRGLAIAALVVVILGYGLLLWDAKLGGDLVYGNQSGWGGGGGQVWR